MGAVVALSLTGVGAANAADRVTFADSVPSWATPANDVGAAPTEETLEGEIYLPLRDQQGAEALAKAVSSPVNLAFRKALNPNQWIKRFSPTQADSDAIVSFLKTAGLTITAVPASRQYVVFRGTADQLRVDLRHLAALVQLCRPSARRSDLGPVAPDSSGLQGVGHQHRAVPDAHQAGLDQAGRPGRIR